MAPRKDEYDDQRQYQCLSKYNKIVNKFDELINMVDMITKPPQRSRGSTSNVRRETIIKKGGRSFTSGIKGSTSSSMEGDNNRAKGGLLVHLITNHLLDLQNSPPFQ